MIIFCLCTGNILWQKSSKTPHLCHVNKGTSTDSNMNLSLILVPELMFPPKHSERWYFVTSCLKFAIIIVRKLTPHFLNMT